MSERKINLEEILKNNNVSIGFLNGMMIPDGIDGSQGQRILNSMIDFAEQILELAAENALLDKYLRKNFQDSSFKYFNNDGYSITINKQSILDTIKQVE